MSLYHTTDKPQIRAKEATRQLTLTPDGKPDLRTTMGHIDNDCDPVIVLVLFGMSKVRLIQASMLMIQQDAN